jgi:hypothetical protein
MNEIKHYQGLRWTARIFGGLIVVLFLYIVVSEYIEELQNPDVSPVRALVSLVSSADGMLFAWISCGIAMVGLILAYWKEGLGGGISLISFILVYIKLESGNFHVFTFISLLVVSIPCVLYLIYWWKMFHNKRK